MIDDEGGFPGSTVIAILVGLLVGAAYAALIDSGFPVWLW